MNVAEILQATRAPLWAFYGALVVFYGVTGSGSLPMNASTILHMTNNFCRKAAP
jgi:hypothetical protein